MEELGQGLCLLTRSLLHTHVGRIWRMIECLRAPRRIGRLIRASSMARCISSREGPRDRIWCTQFRSRESRRSHKTVRSAEYRDRWRWRRFCRTEMRRRSKACCFLRLGSRSMSFRSKFDVTSRKACLAVRGPTQVPRRLMPLSRMASRLRVSLFLLLRRRGKQWT